MLEYHNVTAMRKVGHFVKLHKVKEAGLPVNNGASRFEGCRSRNGLRVQSVDVLACRQHLGVPGSNIFNTQLPDAIVPPDDKY